jgi:hypothetical protein
MGELGGEVDVLGTSRTWLLAVIVAHAVVMFGAPFRMYWRRDAAILVGLPLPGGALYSAALVKGLRATVMVTVPCAVAAAGFALADTELALRHLALVGVAAACAGALAPAAALAAGALVASDKTAALMGSMGGEFQAPKTSWLGLLPGLAATGMALAVIAAADWALGAERTAVGPAAVLLGGSGAAAVLALLASLRAADRVMPAALREVSALDRQRLAHIDRSEPSPLERLAAGLLPAGGRLLMHKDVRLARRRYPIPFALGALGMLFLIGVGIAGPTWDVQAAAVTAGLLGVYGVLMARRRVSPPIELPRFLRTLAIEPGTAALAKRTEALLWYLVYLGPGCALVTARAAAPLTAGVILGAIVLGLLGAALAVAAPPRTE